MKTQNETSTSHDPIDQLPAEASAVQEVEPQAVPTPQKKTVTGFAKAWIIFWIVGNLAATCAPASYLSNSSVAGTVFVFMLLAAIVAAGYFLLLYKNPTGLYMVLIANFLAMLMNGMKVGGYSINVQTGLIVGIITYFITRKQIPYPFWKPAVTK
jgi:hypothetical protein